MITNRERHRATFKEDLQLRKSWSLVVDQHHPLFAGILNVQILNRFRKTREAIDRRHQDIFNVSILYVIKPEVSALALEQITSLRPSSTV